MHTQTPKLLRITAQEFPFYHTRILNHSLIAEKNNTFLTLCLDSKEGRKRRGGKMEEGKGKEREGEVSSIFPPNLSNFGEIMVILYIERGKMDPSFSFPFLPPIFYPNKRFCPHPFLFSSFPSISFYPNKV